MTSDENELCHADRSAGVPLSWNIKILRDGWKYCGNEVRNENSVIVRDICATIRYITIIVLELKHSYWK